MAYIDEITRQIQKAQAEAIRNASSLEEAASGKVFEESKEILQKNLAQQEAQKQAAKQSAASQPADTRTTAQKAADTQNAYVSYQGSEEQKKNQQAANRKALEEAIQRIFAVPGTSASDMPLSAFPQAVDTKQQELKATADYYKGQRQAEEAKKVTDANLAEFESWSAEDKAAMEQYITDRDRVQSDIFGAPQFDTYNLNPVVQKYGIAKVRQMAESIQRSRNEKTAEQVTAAAEKAAEESPVIGSVASVGANLLGAYTGSVEYVKELGNRTGQYSTLDPNNLGGMASQFGGTVRQGVSQRIEGEDGNWLRKLAAIGYEGIMSAADSTARLAAGGFNPGVSAAIAASGSFGNSLRQYSAQGASPEQAAAAALATAGIEYITEKIPMDELLKVGKGGSVMKDVLKQAFLVEPTTEEISLFAGVAAEAAILQDKSSQSQLIGDLIAGGMSYEEAKQEVAKELWMDAARTYAVSAVSGGLSAGGAVAKTQIEIAMENMAAELAARMPKQEPVQQTESEKRADAVVKIGLGIEQPAEQKNTATNGGESGGFVQTSYINKKTGSIATPESAKPTPLTSETTGGTAPKNSIPENSPEVKGTGAAEANFTGVAAYDELLTDDNVQRQRIGDARYDEVPIVDAQGKNVSEFVGNAMNSALTPESFTRSIKKLVQEGQVSHDVQTNEESLSKAAAELSKNSNLYDSVQEIRDFAKSGKTSPEYIAKATLLYQYLTEQIDQQVQADQQVDPTLQSQAEDVFVSLSEMATASGRALQLFNLFRKMTPEGQVNILKKEVTREIEKLQKRGIVKKDYQASPNQNLLDQYKDAAEKYLNAQDKKAKTAAEEEMTSIQNTIYSEVASKLPVTFKAKWDAWRYMAMLGNVKTQLRNAFGNAFMLPYTTAKKLVGAVLEKSISRDQRTKSVFQDKDLIVWAREDRKTDLIQKTLERSAKLGDTIASSAMEDNLRIFNSGILEKVRTTVNEVVSGGDMVFKNIHYERSLASFLRARGYSVNDIQSGRVSDDVLNEARNYAVNEALKATFNDSNALSDAFSSLRFKDPGDDVVKKGINMLGEGIMPFRKTPANIVMRFKDYSPAGLAQGLWNAAFNIRNGKVSAATAVDQLAAGLTGSAAVWLGYALAGGLMGIKLTGSGADEDEERQGHQDYALEFSIGGQEYSYKIDWASPANLPLFLGANLRKAAEAKGEADTAGLISAWMNVGLGVLEPLLELSCLSSINDMFESARYAPEGEEIYSFLATGATSYFTQGIPALARQTAQALQENKQTTFANDEDPIVRKVQQAAAKIPGVFQTDKVNAWGETESTGSTFFRFFNAFVNPGTLKAISNDPVEKELNRLNGVQAVSVSPPTAEKTVSYTDRSGKSHENMRLTEEQYQKLATVQGQTAKKLLDEIINSADYKALTDDQKAKAISAVYEYAKEQGKKAALEDYHSKADAWIRNAPEGDISTFINRGAMSILESAVESTINSLTNGWTVTEAAKKEMDETYAAYDKMSDETKRQILENAVGDVAKYLEIRSGGVSTESYLEAVEDVKTLQPEEGYTSVRDTQRREAIANSGLDEKEIDIVMKAYMTDYDPEDESPDKTELRYDYARQELGLSPAEYAEVYRVQADSGKKADKIAAWVSMGYTQQEATILYNLFAATGKSKIDVESWNNAQ